MRKTATFLIFYLFISAMSNAQNWRLFQGDTVHYLKQEYYSFGAFNQSNAFGLSVEVDTVFNRSNSVTTVFKKDFSDSGFMGRFSSSNCTALNASFFGDSVVVDGDTSTFYIDSTNVQWLHKSNTWTFYSDNSNNQLVITLDSIVSSGSDSLRYYSFAASASPNHDLHQFDTAQMILSKSNGMLEGFDFSVFPDTLEKIEFFKKGPITNRDIYNYEVGDAYHYIKSSDNYNQGIQLNDKYIVKVLNKTTHSPDSVSYEMEYTVSDEYRIIVQGHPSSKRTNYIDTFLYSFNLNQIIGSGNFLDTTDRSTYGIGFYDKVANLSTYVIIGDSVHPIYEVYQNQLCNTFFEHDRYTDYIFGIGSFYHTRDAGMFGAEFYDENLVYYKKGNTTWGNPLTNNSWIR